MARHELIRLLKLHSVCHWPLFPPSPPFLPSQFFHFIGLTLVDTYHSYFGHVWSSIVITPFFFFCTNVFTDLHSGVILLFLPPHTFVPFLSEHSKHFLSLSLRSFRACSSLVALSFMCLHQLHPFRFSPTSPLLVPPSSYPELERRTGRKCVMKQPC